jgi:hypothetical protein
VLDVQAAGRRGDAAARFADGDQRRSRARHAQAVDADRIGAQRQRRCDARQRARPARQLEGLRVFRQVERRVGDVERIQSQAAPEQWAQGRVDHDGLRGEGDAAGRAALGGGAHAVGIGRARHREAHAVQGHRARCGTGRRLPCERRALRQARDDLSQQQVAAADGGEQPPRQQGQHHHAGERRQRRVPRHASRQRPARGIARRALLRRQRHASHARSPGTCVRALTGRRRC